jgi:hypothetical protein
VGDAPNPQPQSDVPNGRRPWWDVLAGIAFTVMGVAIAVPAVLVALGVLFIFLVALFMLITGATP